MEHDIVVQSDDLINIAAWEEHSVANGPGDRYVLWVQGCPFRCPGCSNPSFLHNRPAHVVTVDSVIERILATPGISGVTFSGGEPMSQARSLYNIAVAVKRKNLSVLSYSGYTLQQLDAMDDPWINRLLGELDVLIDGTYEAEQKACLPWRGSRNQNVHFLTETYRHLQTEVLAPKTIVEFIIGESGHTVTGIIDSSILKRIEAEFDRTRVVGLPATVTGSDEQSMIETGAPGASIADRIEIGRKSLEINRVMLIEVLGRQEVQSLDELWNAANGADNHLEQEAYLQSFEALLTQQAKRVRVLRQQQLHQSMLMAAIYQACKASGYQRVGNMTTNPTRMSQSVQIDDYGVVTWVVSLKVV